DGTVAVARANQMPVAATAEKPYSMDRNLLHISFESGVLEDPVFDASSKEMRGMYKLSVAPEDAPNEPEHVDLAFENGNCVAVSGGASSREPAAASPAKMPGVAGAPPSKMSPL